MGANGGDLRQTLTALLSSQEFYASRASIIRSPVEFVVGALRASGRTDLGETAYLSLTGTLGKLGQDLLHPPTVKGWDGGREWINDTTLLLRMQAAAALTLGDKAPRGEALTPLSALGRPDGLSRALGGLMGGLNERQRSYLMLISPEYQLI